MKQIRKGVYPTMITPYTKDGEIDYAAVRRLTEWYMEKGCTGIFAVCQSSEMAFLSLAERVKLAATVVETANGRVSVVASGHCAETLSEQAKEVREIAATGVDAFVLVSNRLDLHHDGDDAWIDNAARLLDKTGEVPLGIYECPKPYKRLLTPRILDWCLATKRFLFIKDTCCDPTMLEERLGKLRGSDLLLFNANAQTLLYSLERGAAGYSGIMANFHPELFNHLCAHFAEDGERAARLSALLAMMAWTESPAYPCTAKWYLNAHGVPMNTAARSADEKLLTLYQKLTVEQMETLAAAAGKELFR